jgi:putative addiction module antidote
MHQVKITSIGNSLGVILPREVLAAMKVTKGDRLFVVETAGGVALTPFDEAVAEQLAVAARIMREDRDVLRKLAE